MRCRDVTALTQRGTRIFLVAECIQALALTCSRHVYWQPRGSPRARRARRGHRQEDETSDVGALQEGGQPEAGERGAAPEGDLLQRFDELVALTPDNQRVQLLAAAASQNVTYIYNRVEESSKQLEDALDTATATINGLQEFPASFKDNPGRRLISLYMGAAFGLAVAGIFSLDIFQAVLDTPPAELDGALLDLRVIFTGLVIGLGSNPTHEVIGLIQEYKENRKGANVARPKLP